MSRSLLSASRAGAAGLVVAAVVFLAGCHLNPGAMIPSHDVGRLLRLAEADTSEFHIDVAPEFRDRVPDRDSGLRRYRPYPE